MKALNLTLFFAAAMALVTFQNCSELQGSKSSSSGSASNGSPNPTGSNPAPSPSSSPTPTPSATPTTSACTYGGAFKTVDDFAYGSNYDRSSAKTFTADSLGNVFTAGVGNASPSSSTHLIVRKSADHGATWSVVDDFEYVANSNTVVAGMTSDGLNNLYLVGSASNAGVNHMFVRKSGDHGLTWSTVDDFVYVGGLGNDYSGVVADNFGNVFAVGTGQTTSGLYRLLIRKSSDQGKTWATVDDYAYGMGANSGSAITVDLKGNIYAFGEGAGVNGLSTWFTRKSSDHGATWATVDDYVYPGSVSATPYGAGVDLAGNVYSVGGTRDSAGVQHYLVRKSSDGGATWSTVDDVTYGVSPTVTPAYGFAADSIGGIYTVGEARDTTTNALHWITRKSTDGGATWKTIDDFVYGSGYALGSAIGFDNVGNLFMVGQGDQPPANGFRYLTRSLSCH